MTTNKFNLLTTFTSETNKLKIEEYLICINKNIGNKWLKNICILYEGRDTGLRKKLSKMSKIKLVDIKKRPTFRDLFIYSNQKFPNQKVIISNADIYFDDTLSLISNYDFENKLFSITRWNISDDNKIYLQCRRNPFYPWKKVDISEHIINPDLGNIKSIDSWIFQSPLEIDFSCDIELGTYKCDSLLVRNLLLESKLKIYNPCYSIRTLHYDFNVDNREWDFYIKKNKIKEIGKGVPWCSIKDTMK